MTPQRSPFQRLLGTAFEELPRSVRDLHSLSGSLTTGGLADVSAAPGLGPWLICKIGGLPQPGRAVPVTVSFHPDGQGGEFWQRRFADRRYASTMRVGGKDAEGLLAEKLGLFDLYFRLTPRRDGLAWLLVRWHLFGVRLPAWTVPKINCFESEEADRFVFDIDAVFPIVGRVIHYRGWLVPQEERGHESARRRPHRASARCET